MNELARLEAELPEAKRLLAELKVRFYGNLHFQIKHPEALRRLAGLDSQIATVGYEMAVERRASTASSLRPHSCTSDGAVLASRGKRPALSQPSSEASGSNSEVGKPGASGARRSR